MITFSNFVVLGVIEVYAMFVGALIVLIFSNRSLSLRISKLQHLVLNLKRRLSEEKTKPKDPEPDFLDSALLETIDRFKSISANQDICLSDELEAPAFLTALRYEFLQLEHAVAQTTDSDEKWETLSISLATLLNQLQSPSDDKIPQEHSLAISKESWQDLCEAVIQSWEIKSIETEDNLMALFQVVNSELGFNQLDVPEKKALSEQRRDAYNKNVEAVNELKESAGENNKLIASLLSQKDAAESEVSIKTEELVKLQRFLKESEVCIKLIEDELEDLREELKNQLKTSNDTEELQGLIQSFAKESSEMLTCIDTLEKENTDLRRKLSS